MTEKSNLFLYVLKNEKKNKEECFTHNLNLSNMN